MSLETIVSGITYALKAIAEHSSDIKVSGGKIC
jgi:pyroglutamyl-peptidase I